MSVLELVGAGLTNRDIAERLYLSINSVKTYIRTAYRKIGVSRRAEAVLWAVHHDLGPSIAGQTHAPTTLPSGLSGHRRNSARKTARSTNTSSVRIKTLPTVFPTARVVETGAASAGPTGAEASGP